MEGAPKGLIFDIQRFSVHDGPGIRTTVFLKGCPLRCPWCQNPESLRPRAEIAFYADRCRGSGGCFPHCEARALRRDGDRVDRIRCDACSACVDACPYNAYQLVGREMGVEPLIEEILRDRPFYETSGGGVTFSGGEPTLQMEFLGAVAARCRESGVRVCLQTCGLFGWEAFEPLLGLFEFIQFDLKIIDAEEHRAVMGADNRVVLGNARRLVELKAPVVFRMPVVPGFTDPVSNLRDVAAFLGELGVSGLHLLPYHAMGEAKLPRLGYPLPALGIPESTNGREALGRAERYFREAGFEVAA
ncbi:MAG: glycyl-radical enzyme activating protein [Nitrospirae bacterium]|nr:glycyl-radical enzyme activating protein [Nitrospirota bacterium]